MVILIIICCLGLMGLLWFISGTDPEAKDKEQLKASEVTLLIPIYNGAHRIPRLIEQLKGFIREDQAVCFVLNGCTDHSAKFLKSAIPPTWSHISVLQLDEAHKKKAIIKAVEQLNTPRVMLLDDDINIHPKAQLDKFLGSRNAVITVYGIDLKRPAGCSSLLWLVQVTEWAYLQFLTLGVRSKFQTMANGACLLCKKDIIASAYTENLHLKTGDDVFLIDYAQQHKLAIEQKAQGFVSVEAMASWENFARQRCRWGSKNHAYKSQTLNIGASIFLIRFVLPFTFIWNQNEIALSFYALLAIVECLLIYRYHREFSLASFLVLLIFPLCYIPLLFSWIMEKRAQ